MRVRVLGPLECSFGDEPIVLGGAKERCLLAVLATSPGRVCSVDQLADALWARRPPAKAAKTVQVYVARLRARLPLGVIRTQPPGYLLDVAPDQVDASAFVEKLKRAQRLMVESRPAEAETDLLEALDLWRGPPYLEFTDCASLAEEALRLGEARAAVLEARGDVALALGRHRELVAETEAACREYPLRERLWVQLITMLYRCDRQADALAAYQTIRRALADEIGADPGDELAQLETRVLRRDPDLAWLPVTPERTLPPALEPSGHPFVGRESELALLQEEWVTAKADRTHRIVAVIGPQGCGRRRLMAEFAAEIHADGVEVALGPAKPRAEGLVVWDARVGSALHARQLRQLQTPRRGPLLSVVLIDVERAGVAARRELLAMEHRELPLGPLTHEQASHLVSEILNSEGMGTRSDRPDVVAAVESAGGWPGAIEAAVRETLRANARTRIAVGNDTAPIARQALVVARNEVIAGVRDLTRVRTQLAAAPGEVVACPYLGLASYDEADSGLFFGREALIASLCGRLVDARLIAVVGPSGSGKSSVVRAGLLPMLASGVLPQLVGLPRTVFTPGAHPMEALAKASTGPIQEPAVIVVDQFEEAFTLCEDDAEREAFINALVERASNPTSRVVMTLRGDFIGDCANYPALADLMAEASVLVGPMRPDEIRRAVEEPARVVGLTVESDLVELVVTDIAGQPAALPLMSTALVEAWERRSGRVLSAAAYLRAGAVSGALARLAEAAYSRMSASAREATRAILLRLAESGEAGMIVRRRVPLRELGDDAASREALQVLTQRRLVTAGEAGVEVTHEALLSHWPRLVTWLADDANGREVRRHLAPAALDWEDAGRPDSELYRGIRLAAATEWAAGHRSDLTSAERAFVDASREYSDKEVLAEIARADREAAGRRRLRQLLAAAAVLLVVAVTGSIVAVDRQRAASLASQIADARRLAAQALVEEDLERSLLLATQAVRIDDSWETRGSLLAVLARQPRALGQVHGVGFAPILDLALTSDGKTVVAGDNAGNVMAWDADSLRPVAPAAHIADWSGRLSAGPSPSTVLLRLHNRYAVYDFISARIVMEFYPPGDLINSRPMLTGGGSTVIIRTHDELLYYDVLSGRLGHRVALAGPGDVYRLDAYRVITPSVDGNSVLVVDSRTWNVRPIKLPALGVALAASADARQIAATLDDGGVAVVDTATGQVKHRLPAGSAPDATSIWLSPDGRRLAIGKNEGGTALFDVNGAKVADLDGYGGPIRAVIFGRDGRTLYTASMDNTMIAWDVSGERTLGFAHNAVNFAPTGAEVENGYGDEVDAEFSVDGQTASLGLYNGHRVLVDMASGKLISGTAPPRSDVWWITDSPGDGVRYVGTKHGLIKTDLRTGKVLLKAAVDADRAIIDLRLSADGRRLTIISAQLVGPDYLSNVELSWNDARAWMLDSETLQPIGKPLPLPPWVDPFVAWPNTDGSTALVIDSGNLIAYVDIGSGRVRWTANIGSDNGIVSAAFPPGGRSILVGTHTGALIMIDAATGRQVARVEGAAGLVRSLAVSPDGQLVAAGGGTDGTVRVFTLDGLTLVGRPLGASRSWVFPTFSPDGRTLMLIDEVGAVSSWTISRDALINRACSIVHRNLTAKEWTELLPTRKYQATCPGADRSISS